MERNLMLSAEQQDALACKLIQQLVWLWKQGNPMLPCAEFHASRNFYNPYAGKGHVTYITEHLHAKGVEFANTAPSEDNPIFFSVELKRGIALHYEKQASADIGTKKAGEGVATIRRFGIFHIATLSCYVAPTETVRWLLQLSEPYREYRLQVGAS